MMDAHAKDDATELDDAGNLPVIMHFGHQEADRIRAHHRTQNKTQYLLTYEKPFTYMNTHGSRMQKLLHIQISRIHSC